MRRWAEFLVVARAALVKMVAPTPGRGVSKPRRELMHAIRFAGFLAMAGCAFAAHAQVASFDCARAGTPTEKAICRRPSLGERDVRAAVYYELLMSARPAAEGMAYREFRDQLKAEQQQWLAQRDRCGSDEVCLSHGYDRRIDDLRRLAAQRLRVSFDDAAPAGGGAANATYTIDGTPIRLASGRYAAPAAPGSSALRQVALVGAPARGNLGGRPVEAVVLSDDGGGSGTFFYVAVVPEGGRPTPAVFLGDRIAYRSVAIGSGAVVVSYLDRAPDAPRSAPATVPVEKRFVLKDGKLQPARND
jgi:uncharacterized protein